MVEQDNYDRLSDQMEDMVKLFGYLSGDEIGPSDKVWQELAEELEITLALMKVEVESMRLNGGACFPSLQEIMENQEL